MRYEEIPPAGELRGHVECFWQAVDRTPRAGRPPEHIVPDGCPEIIVHLGDPFSRRMDGRWRPQGRAFLAGTLSRPWILRPGSVVDTFGIRFRPGSLPALFAVEMRSTVDRELSLQRLAGVSAARDLRQALTRSPHLTPRAAAAESWLTAAVGVVPRSVASPCTRAIALIVSSRGSLRINEIARRLELSPRQLERAFAAGLGIGPKLYARIVRLQAALLEIGDEQRAAGVEAALAAGYFDQSHLLRDFRGLAGRAARRPRRADGEMARHFTAPERLLSLLGGE